MERAMVVDDMANAVFPSPAINSCLKRVEVLGWHGISGLNVQALQQDAVSAILLYFLRNVEYSFVMTLELVDFGTIIDLLSHESQVGLPFLISYARLRALPDPTDTRRSSVSQHNHIGRRFMQFMQQVYEDRRKKEVNMRGFGFCPPLMIKS